MIKQGKKLFIKTLVNVFKCFHASESFEYNNLIQKRYHIKSELLSCKVTFNEF